MRRRTCLATALVGMATIVVGGAVASAASAAPAAKVLRCGLSLAVVPPSGSAAVTQPPSGGWAYGPVQCRNKGLASGNAATSFIVPENGNMVGSYTQYFGDGSIWGKFVLIPDFSSGFGNFTSETWKGKVWVRGGSGSLTGTKSLRPGVMKCTSPDTVHIACHVRVAI